MGPTQVTVEREGQTLALLWADGGVSRLDAPYLRSNCRSAPGLRERLDAATPPDYSNVAISAVQPVGGYGLNIRFSDGHDRGIYPWKYLMELARQTRLTATDFLTD